MKHAKGYVFASLIALSAIVWSCSKPAGEGVGPEMTNRYHITSGACGQLVFVESVGIDSASAAKVVRQRQAASLGRNNFIMTSTSLTVEDEKGSIPAEKFFAMHVFLDDSLQMHLIPGVITDKGNLYRFSWCPD